MQRPLYQLLDLALGCSLMCLIPLKAGAQTPWPPLCLQDAEWTDGAHHYAVTQPIHAPCSPTAPISITNTADAELVSGTEVHLMDGFHAGDFAGDGQLHAYIDEGLGAPADVVLIAPDPGTHLSDNMVRVEKWEKLEVGLRLPHDYLTAIDSFFVHYYSNGPYTTTTPDSVDATYDLNPYADDSLQLVMTLTSPSGAQRMKWGFYMREAQWSSPSDTARITAFTSSPMDAYRIRFRFAPDEEGLWQFSIAVHAPHTRNLANVPLPSLAFSGYAFVCDPPLADNHGFLQVNSENQRILRFDDGTPFFGMGVNMADIRHAEETSIVSLPGGWYRCYQRDRRIMDRTMRQLHEVGGNYLRMSFRREVSAPEWVNAGVYDSYYSAPPCDDGTGLRDSNNCQYFAWDFDRMLDTARLNDLYIQLNIEGSPPGSGGEKNTWGNHPYVQNFLYPHRDPGTGLFDMKRFYFTPDSAGNPQYDVGVFYYWKRKFKYLSSRWGYSVNMAVLEPFNEVDLFLGNHDQPMDTASNCMESPAFWPADPELPSTVDHWYSKLIEYVRGVQVPEDPVASPLGDGKRLFLVSYAESDASDPAQYYLHYANPEIDLIDAHMYLYSDTANQGKPDGGSRWNFDKVQDLSELAPKPFIAGEVNQFTYMAIPSWDGMLENIFHNYDVSFHNELWSGAFSGKFATGMTWFWERVFWWEGSLKPPPPDLGDPFYTINNPSGFSNQLDDPNVLSVDGNPISVSNRSLYHQFKPLADMLSDSDWVATDFFNSNFIPQRVHDTTAQIESYYLLNAGGTMAIGWVHNLNAWTMNNFYLASSLHNFLGCASPQADSVILPGFAQDHDFFITWFPTRMNGTVLPTQAMTSSGDGEVTLDISQDPLNGIANNYLDTLHSDYAFIIAPYPVVRSMIGFDESDITTAKGVWDFGMFPNPAGDELFISLPNDLPKHIVIEDLTGRQVRVWNNLTGTTHRLSIGQLARGAYHMRISDGTYSRLKKFIVN